MNKNTAVGQAHPSDLALDLGIKRISIEAVVIRANGDREPLGVVSEWNREEAADAEPRRQGEE